MSKPVKKLAKKRAAKASSPRTLAAQPQSPTNTTTSKDGKSGLEKISKQDRVIDLLRSPNGTSIASVIKLTGWQQHSVRGFLAGVIKKKLDLKLSSETKEGVRLYRIPGDQNDDTSGEAQASALMSIDADDEIEAELKRIQSMTIADLRALWRAKVKSEPPEAFGPDLLRRSIAQKLQEDAYGRLDRKTSRLLNQLIVQSAKTNGKIVLPRRIKLGAMLVREWKGKSHRITVLNDGFGFEGKPYDSLSEIARLITGTRWNGPRFFGLRPDKEQS